MNEFLLLALALAITALVIVGVGAFIAYMLGLLADYGFAPKSLKIEELQRVERRHQKERRT